ncbi:MAG: exo-alpha-sialidase [Lentisphaeria bacterium]|nr:exo-alpha-sialidase [Lentisphaeria bacterium]
MAEFNPDFQVKKFVNCAPEHFLREALICGDLLTYTTGGQGEPHPLNYTQLARIMPDGRVKRFAKFIHPGAGIFTTALFSPAANEIHAFFQFHHAGEWMTRLENRRTVSYDNGNTWSVPEPFNDNINNYWTGTPIISNKRWLIPVAFAESSNSSFDDKSDMIKWAKNNFNFRSRILYSDDDGRTFKESEVVPSDELHLNECRIVRLADGRIMMLMRSWDSQVLFRSFSNDNGLSWSKAQAVDIPNPSAKILLLAAPDGRIALVHNPVVPRRSRLELWLGDGAKWDKKIFIAADNKRNLNYPDGYFDTDGNLHLIWEDARSVFNTVISNKFFK